MSTLIPQPIIDNNATRGICILVCGGRDYANGRAMYKFLDGYVLDIHERHGQHVAEVIHGGASGADSIAGCWARDRGLIETVVPADWGKYGRRAGPVRNAVMADMAPDVVIAFPGGRGTADMVNKASCRRIFIVKVPA